ncbi:MAG: hypothetical protein L0214_15565 [candidate division NC10 bacterium]|nr:hypothetical protein [candidate division NC10 bacterium]
MGKGWFDHGSPWRSGFARRTYLSGALWAAGLLISRDLPDHVGWLALRTDPAGILYAAASVAGGANSS